MSPQLTDFLSALFSPEGPNATPEETFALYERFVQGSGIEFFNFGIFEVGAQGPEGGMLFGSNMPADWIKEYTARGMGDNDYVARQALGLTEDRHHRMFGFGDWLAERLDGEAQVSAPVLRGAADAGLSDAIGVVGRTPVKSREGVVQYFGLGLGGESGSAAHALSRQSELLVASFAMIDRLRPQIAAFADDINPCLSGRELDVLARFAAGQQRDQVAHELKIALPTVDHHSANIRRKLDAPTLAGAVARAYRYGLLLD